MTNHNIIGFDTHIHEKGTPIHLPSWELLLTWFLKQKAAENGKFKKSTNYDQTRFDTKRDQERDIRKE